jgi:1,4-dihydroxy-2-naphthoate octaprenyltransferase
MIKIWFLAMRPWSFTASFVPIALGAALAATEGSFNIYLFILTLVGGVIIHAGTNLINTYGDYIRGVDTIESALTCPQLVTGVLKPRSVKLAGIIAFCVAGVPGILLTWLCGWPVFAIGSIGIIAGYCYTAGIYPYKYKGLGSILVFFLMGPLLVWPSYYIQTGQYSLIPILVSLPVGLLVSAILHSNDIRDIFFDKAAGIKTFALSIGFRKSLILYYALYAGAYIGLITLVAYGVLPNGVLLTLLLVPVIIKMFRCAYEGMKGSDEKIKQLEPRAASFHFKFGILLILGLLIPTFLDRWFHL